MAAATPEQGLKTGLAKIFTSEKFSDFTIKCGPYEFKVHKAIICAQSEYFYTVCAGRFQEGASNTITLDASEDDPASDDPEAIKKMVHFFYHLDYDGENRTVSDVEQPGEDVMRYDVDKDGCPFFGRMTREAVLTETDSNALAHAKVFAAAVKYHVEPLRALATDKFETALQIRLGDPSFAQAITTVYTTTANNVRELRDVVANTLTENRWLLGRKEVEDAVCGLSGLSFALLLRSQSAASDACPQCGQTTAAHGIDYRYCSFCRCYLRN